MKTSLLPWHLKRLDDLRWDRNMPMWFRLACQRLYIRLYRHDNLSFDETVELLGKIFMHCLSRIGMHPDDENVELPDIPLLLMLSICQQNDELSILNPDGRATRRMTVADRGVAAVYAFKSFGDDPVRLLEVVGYTLSNEADEFT